MPGLIHGGRLNADGRRDVSGETGVSESTELQRAVEALTASIGELRAELVRKDVYQSDQRNVEGHFVTVEDKIRGVQAGVAGNAATIERIEERRAADRRLLLTSFALPLILIILNLYLAAQTGRA
jgi:hypothetical protein